LTAEAYASAFDVSSPREVPVIADAQQHSGRAGAHERMRAWNAPAYNTLVVASVVFGCTLRVTQYAANRSLWLDASALALNILGRSFSRLLAPLALDQGAPPGFLLAEKAATDLFGASEYALRLVPLLCGLAALPLFALLARRLLGPWAAGFATLLFACAGALTYYAAEVKQYSTEFAATLLLLLLGMRLWEKPVLRRRTAAAFALAGCIALFFSYAAVFPAVAIIVVLAARELARRSWRLTAVLAVACAWGLASLLVVVFSRHATAGVLSTYKSDSSVYISTSSGRLLPSLREPPSSLAEDIFGFPLPSPLYWGMVAIAFVGLIGIARRRPAYAGFFVGTGLLMLIASSIHRYPIAARTVLFLIPIATLLIAEGVSVVAAAARRSSARSALAAGLAVVVLALPAARAVRRLVHPQKHEEIKAALATIRRDWKPTDTLYVSYPTQFALRYYLECDCFDTPRWAFRRTDVRTSDQNVPLRSRRPNLIAGLAPLDGFSSYVSDVRKLDGRRRVWLLYSHVSSGSEFTFLRDDLPRKLSAFGRLRRTFTAPGVTLYLYDLRRR
jgi:dolichyl-phosphate-mannose-protein mannosyltransferase